MTAVAPDSPIRNPHVAQFVIGRFAAVAGAQILSVAVGWHLYQVTHDAWSLGLVGAFELAPVLLLMIPAGNAADRLPRRNVALFAHALLGVAALGLAFAAWQGAATAFVYALLVIVGVARACASPSVSTILPQLLPRVQLAQANAWVSSSFELASIIGPALGGFLIALTGGATVAFVVAALGQAVFMYLLARLPAIAPIPTQRRHDAAELFAGLRFIRRNPVFLAAITLDLFAVLLGGAVALLPMFAEDILHVGPTGLGLLRAAPACGALSMALALTRLPPFGRPGRVLLTAVTGFGLATIGFGLSRSLALSLVCLYLTGAFDAISVVIRMTLEQAITPDRLRGRVSAINYVFIGFSNEFGSFESGATAKLFGAVPSVVGGGIGTLIVVATVLVAWPELLSVAPLHTLLPAHGDDEELAASEPTSTD